MHYGSIPLDSDDVILYNMDYNPKTHVLSDISKCPMQLCLALWPRDSTAPSGNSLSDIRCSGHEEFALCYKDMVCHVAAGAQSARENTAGKG